MLLLVILLTVYDRNENKNINNLKKKTFLMQNNSTKYAIVNEVLDRTLKKGCSTKI